jgi:protein-disulfide isomerase
MTKILFGSAFFSSIFCIAAFAASSDAPNGSALALEVDGAKITLAEVLKKQPGVLIQPRNGVYEAERKAIDSFIDDYLLEQQAKKENVTVAQLLERHVNSTIAKDPSDEALHVYYEGLAGAAPQQDNYESVKDKIVEHLREIRTAKAKAAYMQALRSQAKIAVRLEAPRTMISLKDTPIRGAANAAVTLVEYADFECPYCQQIKPVLDRVEATYKGQVALAYKDTPLPMHSHAPKAAEAARCAFALGKYWEYHDMLFDKKGLELPQLKEYARAVKLDGEKFDKCLDSGEQAGTVKSELEEASSLSIQGTPSFFVNGRFISGMMNFEQLSQVINEELAAASAGSSTIAKSESH